MMRINERRIERRKVRAPFVICAFEGAHRSVDTKSAEHDDDRNQFEPPRIATHGFPKPDCGSRLSHEGVSVISMSPWLNRGYFITEPRVTLRENDAGGILTISDLGDSPVISEEWLEVVVR